MTDLLNPNGDPRGPMRRIVSAGSTTRDNHIVTLECGHMPELAQHFWYKVGNEIHCFQCGPKAKPDAGPSFGTVARGFQAVQVAADRQTEPT